MIVPPTTRQPRTRLRRAVAPVTTAALVAGTFTALTTPASADELVNLALGRPATASSSEWSAASPVVGGNANEAFDGNMGSRWSSAPGSPQWIEVDLGSVADIERIDLYWQNGSTEYRIEVSEEGEAWTEIHHTDAAPGGENDESIPVTASARYVKLTGLAVPAWGHSLWEFEIHGTPGEPVVDPDWWTPDGGADRVCGIDLVNMGGVTGTAPSGNADDAINGNVWSAWDGGTSDQITFDLGAVRPVCGVKPYWGFDPGWWDSSLAGVPDSFTTLVSLDGETWTSVDEVDIVDGEPRPNFFTPTDARYVRFEIDRGSAPLTRIRDLEIFAARDLDLSVTELLGDNTFVIDPSMDTNDLQAILDAVYAVQERDQFGTGRYVFLFTPGVYDVDARVGFYTSLIGAGLSPQDVELHSGEWVDAEWFNMNATQNFWRSAENLTYVPTSGEDGAGRWGVSQAAPLRRINVEGDLRVDSGRYGWASGGYIADSRITGEAFSWTQQQWYTRDSEVGNWNGGVWNMVFTGVEGDVTAGIDGTDVTTTLPETPGTWPAAPVTALEHTGVVAEKPFLYLTGDDVEDPADWAVLVPEVREGTTGTTWADGPTAGESIPLTEFLVVKDGTTVAEINAALAAGSHLLFTPGVYEYDETIEVTEAGTVVLGLGLATIIPAGGGIGMNVADEPGIRVAGLLFDAAVTESPALFVVGEEGVHQDNAADPIVLSDIFLRVGGPVAGKVETAMIVHADDTVVDHVWSWRGDHGEGIGWDLNTSDFGFVVNGDDVSAYGLFVEHYQKYNTLWNGERGRTLFYQNELPYDPPSVGEWMNGPARGWAAYKVADHVREHEAWGLGSYSNFWEHTEDNPFIVDNGFEVPRVAGVQMHHLLTISLGGAGVIESVINGVGDTAQGTDTIPAYVTFYGGDAPFADVHWRHPFVEEIEWLYHEGLSTGTEVDGKRYFNPAGAMSRQAMAAFIFRYIGDPDWEPAAGTQTFPDVPTSSPFYREIEWMAAEGLAEGYADGTFGPGNAVSRQAMAAFLHRLAGSPDAEAPTFSDVPAGHPFAEAIGWLETTGIAQGYSDGTFGPGNLISRQAMAAYLFRFDVL